MPNLIRIMRFISISLLLSVFFASNAQAEEIEHPHTIGSSVFLLGNLAPGDPPNFFQLNYGYRFSKQSNLLVEATSWTYYNPLGEYEKSEKYPGKVNAYGIGVGYQHFWWKNLYTTAQATPFYQQFVDKNDKELKSGLQLYLQFKMGYRVEFFNDRWFIEPALALKYWPVNNNMPESFKKIEDKVDKNYAIEPAMHFGFVF